MDPLSLVRLSPLMDRTSGIPEVRIGLIDGPVAFDHPGLQTERIRQIAKNGGCTRAESFACRHGTFVAGILTARRDSAAPATCPGCTLLVRPIFGETRVPGAGMPSAPPEDLAQAIHDCIDAGARLLNISAALTRSSYAGDLPVSRALDRAASRRTIVVAAAGNQGSLGSTALTRHPWVIPIAAYDRRGRPMNGTNLGRSIGSRGLGAPGEGITSLRAGGATLTLGGSSAAAPFVTGALALLWSEFPNASAGRIRFAALQASAFRRTTVVPPLLDAWAAYRAMRS
jgi:subtilisin family serine protease